MHETQGKHIISIDELTRVEGQGALYVRTENGRVAETRFKIFEPPRFFEGILRGREFHEVPDITARICGICPVAYQMSSCYALESLFGGTPPEDHGISRLRRLFYCGEWIESHALHAYFLHLPDFFGVGSAIAVAERHPHVVEQGIRIRRAGNTLLTLLGGRPMHPVGAKVGGWHRVPRRSELEELKPELEQGLRDAEESARWMHANLTVPEFEQDYEFIALRHGTEYPMNEGRIASTSGWDCAMQEWDRVIEERQVEHSNAYQAVLRESGKPYHVGRWRGSASTPGC
jgi:sulfhydrogenase subunit alpha